MRLIVIILVSIFYSVQLQAQGKIEFAKITHDFGDVDENAGPIDYSFQFKNTGDQPIKIIQVKASCGCTTPGWTKELVMPGDSGFIKAQYNPRNRPGQFKKSLQVTSNAPGGNATLFIEGYVKPAPKTVAEELPLKMGGLRIKYKSLNLGRMTNEKPVFKSFDIHNDADEAMSLVMERGMIPEFISLALQPQTLEPNESGQLVVTYDPKKKGSLGFHTDNVRFFTSEAPGEMKELFVVATIEEYFPPMTAEEKANAPRLAIDRTNHDFGRLTEGNTVKTTFQISNTGKNTLSIRDTRGNCGCTVSSLPKTELKPGESIPMTVTFNTSGRRGRQYKTVTIFSNDPIGPSQMISIRADVN
tara:strand:+ start:45230 stop:46303 length:1074 start_codon:yes stop_codon:yes gene_type:complete